LWFIVFAVAVFYLHFKCPVYVSMYCEPLENHCSVRALLLCLKFLQLFMHLLDVGRSTKSLPFFFWHSSKNIEIFLDSYRELLARPGQPGTSPSGYSMCVHKQGIKPKGISSW